MTTPSPPQPPGAGAALRLTYEYDADGVRLVAQRRVDVVVQVAQPANAGHVVDVVDADGRSVARVPVHTDLGATTEVFGGSGEPIVRLPNPSPRGAFTVLVPTPVNAARAVLQRLDPAVGADPDLAPRPDRSAPARVTAVVLSDDQIEV